MNLLTYIRYLTSTPCVWKFWLLFNVLTLPCNLKWPLWKGPQSCSLYLLKNGSCHLALSHQEFAIVGRLQLMSLKFFGPFLLSIITNVFHATWLVACGFLLVWEFWMTTLVNTGRFIHALMDWDLEAENMPFPCPYCSVPMSSLNCSPAFNVKYCVGYYHFWHPSCPWARPNRLAQLLAKSQNGAITWPII